MGVGDVATWALVVVSAGALVLALLAARWSHQAFAASTRAAERAEDARREAHEREQAASVAAWPLTERETFQKSIQRGVVGAAVRNASAMPVYNVEIVYRDPGAGWSAIRRLNIVPPSDEPHIYAGFDEEDNTGTPSPDRVNKDGSVKLLPSAEMRVEVRFADMYGRRWSRDDNGVLAALPATPEPAPAPVAVG